MSGTPADRRARLQRDVDRTGFKVDSLSVALVVLSAVEAFAQRAVSRMEAAGHTGLPGYVRLHAAAALTHAAIDELNGTASDMPEGT